MEDYVKEIANSNGQYIVLSTSANDPSVWKLIIYKKILFFKKKIKSYWFNDKEQAMEFADKIIKKI